MKKIAECIIIAFKYVAQYGLYGDFLRFYFYLFLERGEGREKEREKNIDVSEKHKSVTSCTPPTNMPTTQACALTGNRTGDLSVCRIMPNPLSHTSQATK